jgi:hypothetical protein
MRFGSLFPMNLLMVTRQKIEFNPNPSLFSDVFQVSETSGLRASTFFKYTPDNQYAMRSGWPDGNRVPEYELLVCRNTRGNITLPPSIHHGRLGAHFSFHVTGNEGRDPAGIRSCRCRWSLNNPFPAEK